MDIILPIAIVVVAAILAILLVFHWTRLTFEKRFWQWREIEEQRWEQERESIRKEAIAQSRTVLGGKFVEQLVPYLPEFKYDPTEARFIGTPIDLIVFPGLATGNPKEIVIIGVMMKEIPCEFGEELSEKINTAVPKAVEMTLNEIKREV